MGDLAMDITLLAIALLSAAVLILQILSWKREARVDLKPIETALASVEKTYERIDRSLREEFARNREEIANSGKALREELRGTMAQLEASLRDQLGRNTATMEARLKSIQDDNTKQLEQMRLTVDEKLQGTLEKRLGESFKTVSDRLEQVHKGLGEMQALATGVGDLKRVLTSVKLRGTWGEVQLGTLLEQALTSEQYATNVATIGTSDRVEFAIKLPGRSTNANETVWLPIDAKFPIEDYQRLLDAQEKADPVAAEQAASQLEIRIKGCAKDIAEKYLNPPQTTDFGILYLPTEGLFAEVMKRPGLADTIQNKHRVVIAGPTTLWSLLNSLQMGFRTLAIEKRSSDVWKLLAAVKTEWTKYGEVLDKVQKKLQEASNTVEDANKRTRVIGRKLKTVEELSTDESLSLLNLDAASQTDED
jgi:DNA recombination protein RmuC